MVEAAFAAGWGILALALGFAFAAPRWLIRRSSWVLAGLATITLAATLGAFDFSPPAWALRIDASTEPLLPLDDPMRGDYAKAIQDFGDDEIYSIAIACGDVFSVRCLDAVERSTARLARLEGVRSVSSLTDVTSYRWVEEREWIEIAPLIDEVPRTASVLAQLRDRTLSDPVYRRTLVSEQGDVAAINLSFRKMSDSEFIASGLDARIVEILEDELPLDFEYSIAGRPHVKVHVYQGIVQDLLLLVPAAVAVMALVLFAFFQSMRGVWLPLGVAVSANLWTFGLIGWSESPLSLLTGLLAPMLIAMGCVYGVHVIARYEEESLLADSPREAALATLLHVRKPAAVAGLTTMIGFAALRVTKVPAVFELGTYAILGVASATCLSLIGIPTLLAKLSLGPRRAESQKPMAMRLLDVGLSRLAHGLGGLRRPLLWFWAALVAGAIFAIPSIVIDTDYLSYFAESDPIRIDFETVNGALAGVVPISVVIDGGEAGALRDPARLRAIEGLDARLKEIAGVSRTVSVLDPLRQLNRAFHRDDPEWERLPTTRPAITEFLFMMPKSSNSRLMTVDHARANLVVRTGAVGSSQVLALSRSIDEAIREDAIPDVAVEVSGNAI
ncbi:MMPL family transporter, partial [Myxococcota bacterium]|nr:MMPL family transporter [Myxococcota bacterium]